MPMPILSCKLADARRKRVCADSRGSRLDVISRPTLSPPTRTHTRNRGCDYRESTEELNQERSKEDNNQEEQYNLLKWQN